MIARQAPLSMGFPRQGYWSGLPSPSSDCGWAISIQWDKARDAPWHPWSPPQQRVIQPHTSAPLRVRSSDLDLVCCWCLFWPCHTACRILASQLGIGVLTPGPPGNPLTLVHFCSLGLFIYLFWAALNLCCCRPAFSSCSEQGGYCSLRRWASLIAEPRL